MTGDTRRPARTALVDGAVIAAAAGALFLPGLGRLHLFDWDEINFAEAAREMIATGNYLHLQIDYRPFAEKPPLFMWLQAAMMRLFGVGEFAARLPSAITGVIVLVGLYALGRQLVDRRFGLLWALAYGGSFLPHLYFRSGIIDPVFNAFIFAGVCGLYWYHRTIADTPEASRHALRVVAAAGVSVGLAVLTKGPVGLLLPGLAWAWFFVVRRRSTPLPIVPVLVFLAAVAAVAAPWYAAAAIDGGGTLRGFMGRQIELLRTGVGGHTGPWYFHLVVLAVGCFPASVFAVAGLLRRTEDAPAVEDFRLWMVLLLAVVIIVFSAVQTKIIHYSSLAYYPISFLAAATMHRARGRYSRPVLAGIASVGLVWAAVLIAVPMIGLNAAAIAPHVRDTVVRAALGIPVRWSNADLLVGGGYAVAIVAVVVMAVRRRRRVSPAPADSGVDPRPDAPTVVLFAGTALATVVAAAVLFPNIERYTQGAPVAFYESLRGRDVYVLPLGFKSYAHLFYARKTLGAARREMCGGAATATLSTMPNASLPATEQWLLHGAIDRPAFFVARIDKAVNWRGLPGLREIGTHGGFTFFARDAVDAAAPHAVAPPCAAPIG